jgi:DNA polymerase-3 subunit delta'
MSDNAITPLAMPLPWQQTSWEQLNRAWRNRRLPHALLLHGTAGIGKHAFAKWLAQALFCEAHALDASSGELKPCGVCASCKLFKAGSHPDFVVLSPEEDKQQISVDQIRAAAERLTMTSGRSGYRVAIVEPAHQMTLAAANSLLKTLEEPGANSLIVLVTSQRSALLPTIRSRCQQLDMPTPRPELAQAWLNQQIGKIAPVELLEFAGGAPLKAMAYLQGSFETLQRSMTPALAALGSGTVDVTQLAQEWLDEYLPDRLNWLDYWLMRLLRQEILRSEDKVTPDMGRVPLQSAAQVLNISALFQSLDKLRELKAQLRRTALQKELALESVLLILQRALSLRPATAI